MMSQHAYGAEKSRDFEAELLTRAVRHQRAGTRAEVRPSPSLRLGDKAPDFTQESTQGPIHLYEWMGDSWAVLFSHPADFTPICTTELGMVARLKPEFDKRNVKAIGLSVDPLFYHEMWARDIAETQEVELNFPLLADADRKVAQLYDMIHPNVHATETVRSVFIIDPNKSVRLTHTYPAATGRNFDEILRAIDSLQLTDDHQVGTPANWKQADDVVILTSVPNRQADKLFPGGYKELKPYLRITAQPKAQQDTARTIVEAERIIQTDEDRRSADEAGRQEDYAMANRLYVGGLSFDTSDEEVKTFFQQAGTVQSATVITDRDSGRSRGFGFVEMSSDAESQVAIDELNGKTLGERAVKVETAKPQSPGGDRSSRSI